MHPLDDATGTAAPLQLSYAFVTTPNPVRASPGEGNPNTVDVQVLVSNPTGYAVQLASIQITIPMGENTARALGSAANLPAPAMDVPAGWRGESSGSTVTLSPLAGTRMRMTGTIIFTLPGITVNTTPGTVPITVTEKAPPAPRVTDSTTYSILKQEADFPVAHFWADPPVLGDLEMSTTLYWKCTAQGAGYTYSVHSDSWHPNDCLGAGDCLQCSDGAAGVATPPLDESTTFALDVISTDAAGHRTIHATLTTQVRVSVPWISQESQLDQMLPSGRLVWLYWLAHNTSRVSVVLDEATVDDYAPANCYHSGYPLLVGSAAGSHTITLHAHAQTGPEAAEWSFPPFTVGAQTAVPGDSPTEVVAFGAGSGMAAVVLDANTLLVDLATRATATLDVGGDQGPVVASADGSTLFSAAGGATAVSVVDVAERTVGQIALPFGVAAECLALTTDGAHLLLAFIDSPPALMVIDVARAEVRTTLPMAEGWMCTGIAPTPDGRTALLTYLQSDEDAGSIVVLDLASWTIAPAAIPLPGGVWGTALSPDGTLLFSTHPLRNKVSVFDVASRTIEPLEIDVGGVPTSVAFTPDGRFALVGSSQGNSVSVIDVPRRRCIPGSFPVSQPVSVAVSPDGSTWVAASATEGLVFL